MSTTTERRPRIREDAIIRVITDGRANPKKEGSAAHKRFELYEDGMTVKEAKAKGLWSIDVTHDFDHRFISLTNPETLVKPPKKPVKPKAKPKAKAPTKPKKPKAKPKAKVAAKKRKKAA